MDIDNILRDEASLSTTSAVPSNALTNIPNLSEDFKVNFRRDLITWYHCNRRSMPWRGDNTNIPVTAYSVWVSEVMLQQTRVDTVIEYWNRWMENFPTVQSLAQASPEDVNRLWAGLGYYRRAQNLLAGAKYVVDKHHGEVPSTKQELLQVPGIGPYTAGAISSIAFSKCEPVVDGNVLRVFSRLFASKLEVGSGKLEKLSWNLAEQLVDPDSPAAFNQAVMELGATVCKPTNPSCSTCPVRVYCKAKMLTDYVSKSSAMELSLKLTSIVQASTNKVTDIEDVVHNLPKEVTFYPRKVEKKKAKDVTLLIHVLCCNSFNGLQSEQKKYLFVKRPPKGLLANQWEFPNIPINLHSTKPNSDDVDDTHANEIDEQHQINSPVLKSIDLYNEFCGDLRSYFLKRCSAQWLGLDDPMENDSVPVPSEGTRNNTIRGSKSTSKIASMFFERVTEPRHIKEPIVHIFSHEKHTMHIVVEDVLAIQDDEDVSNGERSWSWMTATEILDAGITTGCKKILEEVLGSEAQSNTGRGKQKSRKLNDGDERKILKRDAKNKSNPSDNAPLVGDVIDLSSDDPQCEDTQKLDAFTKMKVASSRATKNPAKVQRKRKAPES